MGSSPGSYLAWPALIASGALLHLALLPWFAPVTAASIAIGVAGAGMFVAERVWPASAAHRPLDQPLYVDVLHFLFDYELGYVLAVGVLEGMRRAGIGVDLWPSSWPVAAQAALGMVLSDVVSYGQHRAYHRVPLLWRFHRLHHEGARLNLVRTIRFHWVDVGVATIAAFLPLVLLRAPEDAWGWAVLFTGLFGTSQHANLALPTPRWLDGVLCTPAVHRSHHARDAVEGDRNFGTVVTVIDRLLGTWFAPAGPFPAEVGVEGEELRGGFVRQWLAPFRG